MSKFQHKPLFIPYPLDLLLLHGHLAVHIATHYHHDSPEIFYTHLFTDLLDPIAYSGRDMI